MFVALNLQERGSRLCFRKRFLRDFFSPLHLIVESLCFLVPRLYSLQSRSCCFFTIATLPAASSFAQYLNQHLTQTVIYTYSIYLPSSLWVSNLLLLTTDFYISFHPCIFCVTGRKTCVDKLPVYLSRKPRPALTYIVAAFHRKSTEICKAGTDGTADHGSREPAVTGLIIDRLTVEKKYLLLV